MWVTTNVHKLLHATHVDTIKEYMETLNLDNKQIIKINKLRESLEINTI